MRRITLDIETTSAASGIMDPAAMELSLIGIHDSSTGLFDSFLKEDLTRLWPILEPADILLGDNSDQFNIPILNRSYSGDLARVRSIDLLSEIRNSLGRRLKLASVAQATLGIGKSGSGLDAVKWWAEGDVEKVRKYCLMDVAITKDIYEYALKNGFVYYSDFGEKKKIPLDTSKWETGVKASLTHTLPF